MLRSILVPLDGSPLAEQALPLAASIAQRSRARIDLVQVVRRAVEAVVLQGETVFADEQTEMFRANALRYLERIQQQVQATAEKMVLQDKVAPLHISVRTLTGSAASELVEYARESGADLIVMATHGRTGFQRWTLGSVADEVLRHSHVPVITLRPATAVGLAFKPLPSLDRILVTLDGSALAETVLPLASELAQLFDSELLLFRTVVVPAPMYVAPDVIVLPRDMYESAVEDVGGYLEQIAAPLRAQGLKVRTTTSEDGVVESILSAADAEEADLIAMTTHGRSGL